MRLGLIGDIHGNAAALGAVLTAARAAGIDELCVTGDVVGYYYEPDIVLELLSGWRCHFVRGNHEDLLQEARSDSDARLRYKMQYGCGLEQAIKRLPEARLRDLFNLPKTAVLSFDGRSVLLAHGAPWDTDTYIYPDASSALMEKVAESAVDFVILGHTHYQFDRKVGRCHIVNPGSVGQPRDRKPGAAWSILDTQTGTVEHRREHYDVDLLVAEVQRLDSALPYNWTVLTRT